MSHMIVLVKQVPDVSQITDNAFDPKTGNLIRTRLPSVINELDAQGLAFACHMKQLSSDTESKIICLTMGPPMAAEVLRYGLGRCADTAVLLTDRALGGADTWATANPLAYAVRKIRAELLDGSEDYFIVAGMQSVDGDTAQVPAQMAAELGIPCVPYATKADYKNGQFSFTRIISGGSQVVQPVRSGAMITVAKYEYPLFASFARTRMANKLELIQWGADDVKAKAVGVAGSKTRVIRVFPPGKTQRKCQAVASAKELAAIIIGKLEQEADAANTQTQHAAGYVLPEKRANTFDRSYEGTEKENEDYAALNNKLRELNITDLSNINEDAQEKILADKTISFHKKALEDMLAGLALSKPAYNGDIWVMAEHAEGQINSATFELIGKARELADSLEVRVGVVLAGDDVKSMADELIAAGADDVYVVEHPLLKNFDPHPYCKAVSDVFNAYQPQIFLYGATPQGRGTGSDGFLSCRLRLNRRLYGTGDSRQQPKRTNRRTDADTSGTGRECHGDYLHQRFDLSDGHGTPRRYETPAGR